MKKTILFIIIIWVFSYGLHLFRAWYNNNDEETISHDELVDLSIPSGSLWASINIGDKALEINKNINNK